MTFFSQKSYKDKLGSCKDTIAQSGCFITSLCNLAKVLKTSLKDPKELNEWLTMNGGYTNGCMLISSKGAEGVGLISKGKFTFTNIFPCIAETDHWKSKGVPQHFFVVNADHQILDPIDLEPKWKPNPYHIVSYRVFYSKKGLDEHKKEAESVIIAQEPQKIESDVQVPQKPIQSVESGTNQPTIDSMQGYRTIISAVLAFLVTMGAISQGEADQLTEGVLAILSLVTLVSTIYFRVKANLTKK